jgi:hypothetical protein
MKQLKHAADQGYLQIFGKHVLQNRVYTLLFCRFIGAN